MKNKEDVKESLIRLGLIYSVKDKKFEIIYKDLVTKQIKIGLYDEEEEIPTTTISAV